MKKSFLFFIQLNTEILDCMYIWFFRLKAAAQFLFWRVRQLGGDLVTFESVTCFEI